VKNYGKTKMFLTNYINVFYNHSIIFYNSIFFIEKSKKKYN
jgi:hypothetical protein